MREIIFAAPTAAAIDTASAVTCKVDEHHANTRFTIDHFNTSANIGGFHGLTGPIGFDQAKRTGKIDIIIPVANLQSGSQHFTDHLKSADIFDTAKYPDVRLVSTKFSFSGKKLLPVDGNLTVHGKTAPIKLKAEKFNCYQGPMAKIEVCGGDFGIAIDRTKRGVNYLVDASVTKTIRIDIQIEAAK